MTKRNLALFAALIFVIGNAGASEVAPSKQGSDCEGWPDTSSMYEGCTLNHETEAMQKEIETFQEQILKYSVPAARKELLQSVNAWKRYLERACKLQETVMGGINGISSARCYNSLTKQRLSYLRESF